MEYTLLKEGSGRELIRLPDGQQAEARRGEFLGKFPTLRDALDALEALDLAPGESGSIQQDLQTVATRLHGQAKVIFATEGGPN